MNIVSDVKTYVTTNLTKLYATMTMDAFGVAPEALMVRGDPSSATVAEYIDGSTTGTQTLSFYARSKAPGTAIAALDAIRDLLDKPEISLTSVLCIRVTPRTLPALVSKESTGESIYSMTVDVDYDGKNAI